VFASIFMAAAPVDAANLCSRYAAIIFKQVDWQVIAVGWTK